MHVYDIACKKTIKYTRIIVWDYISLAETLELSLHYVAMLISFAYSNTVSTYVHSCRSNAK